MSSLFPYTSEDYTLAKQQRAELQRRFDKEPIFKCCRDAFDLAPPPLEAADMGVLGSTNAPRDLKSNMKCIRSHTTSFFKESVPVSDEEFCIRADVSVDATNDTEVLKKLNENNNNNNKNKKTSIDVNVRALCNDAFDTKIDEWYVKTKNLSETEFPRVLSQSNSEEEKEENKSASTSTSPPLNTTLNKEEDGLSSCVKISGKIKNDSSCSSEDIENVKNLIDYFNKMMEKEHSAGYITHERTKIFLDEKTGEVTLFFHEYRGTSGSGNDPVNDLIHDLKRMNRAAYSSSSSSDGDNNQPSAAEFFRLFTATFELPLGLSDWFSSEKEQSWSKLVEGMRVAFQCVFRRESSLRPFYADLAETITRLRSRSSCTDTRMMLLMLNNFNALKDVALKGNFAAPELLFSLGVHTCSQVLRKYCIHASEASERYEVAKAARYGNERGGRRRYGDSDDEDESSADARQAAQDRRLSELNFGELTPEHVKSTTKKTSIETITAQRFSEALGMGITNHSLRTLFLFALSYGSLDSMEKEYEEEGKLFTQIISALNCFQEITSVEVLTRSAEITVNISGIDAGIFASSSSESQTEEKSSSPSPSPSSTNFFLPKNKQELIQKMKPHALAWAYKDYRIGKEKPKHCKSDHFGDSSTPFAQGSMPEDQEYLLNENDSSSDPVVSKMIKKGTFHMSSRYSPFYHWPAIARVERICGVGSGAGSFDFGDDVALSSSTTKILSKKEAAAAAASSGSSSFVSGGSGASAVRALQQQHGFASEGCSTCDASLEKLMDETRQRKKVELELRDANKKLQQAEKELSNATNQLSDALLVLEAM